MYRMTNYDLEHYHLNDTNKYKIRIDNVALHDWWGYGAQNEKRNSRIR